MIPTQPYLSPGYFSFKRNKIKTCIYRDFYLSWEDALWDLLKVHDVKTGSIIAVPEFFCWDVVNNMKSHGLDVIAYPVDKNLGTDGAILKKIIKKYGPKIVVVFNAVGIKNNLLASDKGWIKDLKSDCVLIEDSVHRIVETDQIVFLKNNHYIIDSLRKVVPLQGSFMYYKKKKVRLYRRFSIKTFFYKISVLYWWISMQLFLLIGRNRWAEKSMLTGYDIIGDNIEGATGILFMKELSLWLDIKKIKNIKRKQVEFYKKHLKTAFKSRFISPIPFKKNDEKELIGFPLRLDIKCAREFLNHVRNHELLLRFELNDSVWSKKYKIVYLPLGPNVNEEMMNQIVNLISLFFGAFKKSF